LEFKSNIGSPLALRKAGANGGHFGCGQDG